MEQIYSPFLASKRRVALRIHFLLSQCMNLRSLPSIHSSSASTRYIRTPPKSGDPWLKIVVGPWDRIPVGDLSCPSSQFSVRGHPKIHSFMWIRRSRSQTHTKIGQCSQARIAKFLSWRATEIWKIFSSLWYRIRATKRSRISHPQRLHLTAWHF